jgi:hypothetical protein
MEECAGCSQKIHRDELVSAVTSADGKRTYFHKDCELKSEHFARWKEETPWTFKPTRMTVKEWEVCNNRKHLGVWQSVFTVRRDEDVWCPDCGLKIARQDQMTCPRCNGQVIVTKAELTRSLFNHHQPLYRLTLYCTERGETSTANAIISGFTPVTIGKAGQALEPIGQDNVSLKVEPKGDPTKGLKVER